MKITVLSCSLNPVSNSFILARSAVEFFKERLIEVDFIDLRSFSLPFCDGDASYSHPVVKQLNKQLSEAHGMILAVPIYNFYANAVAKNLIELTGKAWEDKVVGFLCAAGGQGSYMSVMSLANSLMLDFRSLVVPRFVYATGNAFADNEIINGEVKERVEQLVTQISSLAAWVEQSTVKK